MKNILTLLLGIVVAIAIVAVSAGLTLQIGDRDKLIICIMALVGASILISYFVNIIYTDCVLIVAALAGKIHIEPYEYSIYTTLLVITCVIPIYRLVYRSNLFTVEQDSEMDNDDSEYRSYQPEGKAEAEMHPAVREAIDAAAKVASREDKAVRNQR